MFIYLFIFARNITFKLQTLSMLFDLINILKRNNSKHLEHLSIKNQGYKFHEF